MQTISKFFNENETRSKWMNSISSSETINEGHSVTLTSKRFICWRKFPHLPIADEVGWRRQVDRWGTPWKPKSRNGVSNSKSRAILPTKRRFKSMFVFPWKLTFIHKVLEGELEFVTLLTLLLLSVQIVAIAHISRLAQIGRNFTDLNCKLK